MEATDYIPVDKFNLWYGLFKKSSGRFLGNPFVGKDDVLVSYSFDDMDDCNEFHQDYRRLTTPITETTRTLWGRIKAIINC